MSYKTPVIKATLNNAAKTMSNTDKQALSNKDNNIEKTRIENRQDEIDNYNFNECNIIDDFFKTIQLIGNDVIIKLHKENYIKSVQLLSEDVNNVIYENYISQVDGRMHASDKAKWIDNPLPYVHSGVIVALSPLVIAEFIEKKNKLSLIDKDLAESFKIPQVGDIVHLTHFMFADFRFYKNKQEKDFIKDPNNYRIEHWEGYVKLHSSYIEAIVKDKESFNITSPYKLYKEFKNE